MNERIQRLAATLVSQGVDVFMAQDPITMDYLHGFPEHSHERFLALAVRSTGEVRLICPALSANQARRAGIEDICTWTDSENPSDLVAALAQDWNLRSAILAVDDDLPAHMLLRMQAVLPAALFKPGGPLVGDLMRVKDDAELALMRHAGSIVDGAFAELPQHLRVGMTEVQIEEVLRSLVRERGGAPSFCAVCIDAGSAEPHHVNGDTPLATGSLLLVDFGCDYRGYQADITRVVAFGAPHAEGAAIYDIVYRAHMAARSAPAGATGAEVDALARNVIVEAGYGDAFFHRTGHGIGRRVHEAPYIVDSNTTPLRPGECYSIEPGIYLEGRFGVRIENIVVATGEGCASLNAEPSPTLPVV